MRKRASSVFKKRFAKGVILAVPQTDTGGRVEYTKAIGRTILKELGNTAGRKLARCPVAARRLQ